jgi:hypothetical protein
MIRRRRGIGSGQMGLALLIIIGKKDSPIIIWESKTVV